MLDAQAADAELLALASNVDGALAPVLDLVSQANTLAAERVSASQLQALRILHRRGPLRLTRLAELMSTTPPSATRLCDRLEAAGLIARVAQTEDRRVVLITLTAGGADVVGRLDRARVDALAGALSSLSSAEAKALLRGLLALASGLDDEGIAALFA